MIKCLPNKLRLKKIILLFLTHGLGGGLLRRTSQCRRLCRSLRLGSWSWCRYCDWLELGHGLLLTLVTVALLCLLSKSDSVSSSWLSSAWSTCTRIAWAHVHRFKLGCANWLSLYGLRWCIWGWLLSLGISWSSCFFRSLILLEDGNRLDVSFVRLSHLLRLFVLLSWCCCSFRFFFWFFGYCVHKGRDFSLGMKWKTRLLSSLHRCCLALDHIWRLV